MYFGFAIMFASWLIESPLILDIDTLTDNGPPLGCFPASATDVCLDTGIRQMNTKFRWLVQGCIG